MIKKWLMGFDEFIAPSGVKCLCCDGAGEGEMLCPTCSKALEAMRLFPEESGMGNEVRCTYRYDGVAKELVLLLKEDRNAFAAHALAAGMAKSLAEMQMPPNTVITWVTMPAIRLKQRGIDHGYELSRAVGLRCSLPVKQLLKRKPWVHTQRGLNREKRLQNLSGTFSCTERLNGPVLLIDDVLTTGATSAACTEVLLAAGATRVYVLTATKATLVQVGFEFRKADIYGFYPS